MKAKINFDDCWKGVIEHFSQPTFTPKQQWDLVEDVQSRAYELLDLIPYDDMAESIVLWLNKSAPLRERVLEILQEEEKND